MVRQFAAAAADPALRDSILPGTPIGRPDQWATQVVEHLGCFSGVFAVTIKDQVARSSVFRKSLSNLLRDPRAGGVLRGIKVEDLPAAMADHKKVRVRTVKKSRAAMTSR
jgi:hypothetical protein